MKKYTKYLLTCLFSSLIIHASAQAPVIQWQKSYGGSTNDGAWGVFIHPTSDSGYLVAGTTFSVYGNVSSNHGMADVWVLKLSQTGNLVWQKTYGGSGDDIAYDMVLTADGGSIIAGSSSSVDGDVSGNHGIADYWILKLSATGAIQWQKSYGGDGDDRATSIRQVSDGGYIVAGYTNSKDSPLTGNNGQYDYWVMKLSDTGRVVWQKCLGGSRFDFGWSIKETTDGGFIVAGESGSNDSDVIGNRSTNNNSWVIKLSGTGAVQWKKCYGDTYASGAYCITPTMEGGYIFTGYNFRNDGDVSGNHGYSDCWVVKLDDTGRIKWQKSLGGSLSDWGTGIWQTPDSGYLITAVSNSNDMDVSGNHGDDDAWLIKLSKTGSMVWQKSFGSDTEDRAYNIEPTRDGGYIVSGYGGANNGDVSGNHGGIDYWILKLGMPNEVSIELSPEIRISPNPTRGELSVSGTTLTNIYVYNVIGELMKKVMKTDCISICELPAGVYIVQLYDQFGAYVGQSRIVKQ